MQREDLKPMVAYTIHPYWVREPITVYVSEGVPLADLSSWNITDTSEYVMVHRFGADYHLPVPISELSVRKPEIRKCSHCGSEAGSGCIQCRPDIMSY